MVSSMGTAFGSPSPDMAVYVISVAAELIGLHPQTLRAHERMGLITPGRTGGGGRRYYRPTSRGAEATLGERLEAARLVRERGGTGKTDKS